MFLAFICFVLAVAVGAWRQKCRVYELHMPINCPSIWRNSTVRVVTWLISTSLSLVFATILSVWVMDVVNEWVGKFSFGVFLFLRWMTSAVFGGSTAIKRVAEFNNEFSVEHVNYDAVANAMMKTRRERGEPEIPKEEIIALLKKSAKDIASNNLDDEEQRALAEFRKIDKRR